MSYFTNDLNPSRVAYAIRAEEAMRKQQTQEIIRELKLKNERLRPQPGRDIHFEANADDLARAYHVRRILEGWVY